MKTKEEAIKIMQRHIVDAEFVRRAENDCRAIAENVIAYNKEAMTPMNKDTWAYVEEELNDSSDEASAMEYLLEKAEAEEIFANDSWAEIGDQVADIRWDSYGEMLTEIGARAFDSINPYTQDDFDRQMEQWREEKEYEQHAYYRDCC